MCDVSVWQMSHWARLHCSNNGFERYHQNAIVSIITFFHMNNKSYRYICMYSPLSHCLSTVSSCLFVSLVSRRVAACRNCALHREVIFVNCITQAHLHTKTCHYIHECTGLRFAMYWWSKHKVNEEKKTKEKKNEQENYYHQRGNNCPLRCTRIVRWF